MHKAFRLLLGFALAAPFALFAQPKEVGTISVAAGDAIAVSLSASTPELQTLVRAAFNTHGKFREVATGGAFAIKFTAAGATQVTVTISKGNGGVVHSETVSGTSLRNALFRAADVAVTKTSGLPGYFAGKIAFVGGKTGKSEIYTSDLFFGDLLRWTSEGKQIVSPRWSPDGKRIIFTSYRTSFPDIYVIDLGTRRISLFASFKGTNSGGRFSPDGSRVAMVLSGDGNPEVYVGNAQGRQVKRLTKNQFVEASPAWSPDGARLVYTSDAAGGPQLYMISAAGGNPTRVPTNVSKYCAEPDWSAAQPNKIAFTAGVGRGFQVAVHDLNGGGAKIVSKAPGDAIEPVWLADGRHVLCTFRGANTTSLWIVDTESPTFKATRISPTAFGNAGSASYLAK